MIQLYCRCTRIWLTNESYMIYTKEKTGGNMDTNIYRTYKFDFDPIAYSREFTKALGDSGITRPAQFNQLLKDMGITDCEYETVRSYFYGRRVPPLNVFIAVCKKLNLSADKIAFPQSIQNPPYNRDLSCCEDYFRNVFYPYNYSDKEDTFPELDQWFCPDTYESNVNEIALILSKYNYLIQKYHYASVSRDEHKQICFFTEKYIIDRNKDINAKPEQIIEWMRNSDDEEFLWAFYNKYTIGFYTMSCSSLLKTLSKAIEGKYIRCAAQLLPMQDMLGEVKI